MIMSGFLGKVLSFEFLTFLQVDSSQRLALTISTQL